MHKLQKGKPLRKKQLKSESGEIACTGRPSIRTAAGGRASGFIKNRCSHPGAFRRFVVLVGRTGPAVVAWQCVLATVGTDGALVHHWTGGDRAGNQIHHPAAQTGRRMGWDVPQHRPAFLPIRTRRARNLDWSSCHRIGARVADNTSMHLGTAGGTGTRGNGAALFIRYSGRRSTGSNRRGDCFADQVEEQETESLFVI